MVYGLFIAIIYYGPKWSCAEMVMGPYGHGLKWLWAEMTRNDNQYLVYCNLKKLYRKHVQTRLSKPRIENTKCELSKIESSDVFVAYALIDCCLFLLLTRIYRYGSKRFVKNV